MEFKKNNFYKNGFPDIVNIHIDLFYCFLRLLQAKICKFPEFGGHLGKMANRKKCSTFGVWLQTDLDSAAQNLMETIIKVYICLKTRFSYQMLGSLQTSLQANKLFETCETMEQATSMDRNDIQVAYRSDLVPVLYRKNLRREFDVRYLIISVCRLKTVTCIFFYLNEIVENNILIIMLLFEKIP